MFSYIKPAIAGIKDNPVASIISIAGTALAIAMIMVIVIVFEARMAEYKPETRRSRTLYVKYGSYVSPNNNSNSFTSLKVIKECFYPLSRTDAVTAVAPYQTRLLTAPGSNIERKGDVSYTDADFWKVFEFRFLSGSPYVKADVESGIHRAVINETMSRSLFGTVDVAGRTVLVSFVEYVIAGVVEDVSTLAESAYAEVWLPHTTTSFNEQPWNENTLGNFRCYILASSPSDIPLIQAEAEENVKRFNATAMTEGEYVLRGQPHTHFVQLMRTSGSNEPDVKGAVIQYSIILFILLLTPAINLSGMILSRMNRRASEIGVRKAFGATRKSLVYQILVENFVLTLIGGFIGLALSYTAVGLMSRWLMETQTTRFLDSSMNVSAVMIVHPSVFLWALLFCIVLNLLSAGIPAWRISGKDIISSLKEHKS